MVLQLKIRNRVYYNDKRLDLPKQIFAISEELKMEEKKKIEPMMMTRLTTIILRKNVINGKSELDEIERKSLIMEHFNSAFIPVNWNNKHNVAQLINDWITEITNNKIRNIVDENQLSNQVSIIIINAIYLKAEWTYKFSQRITRNGEIYIFYKSYQRKENQIINRNVSMMCQNASAYDIKYVDNQQKKIDNIDSTGSSGSPNYKFVLNIIKYRAIFIGSAN